MRLLLEPGDGAFQPLPLLNAAEPFGAKDDESGVQFRAGSELEEIPRVERDDDLVVRERVFPELGVGRRSEASVRDVFGPVASLLEATL